MLSTDLPFTPSKLQMKMHDLARSCDWLDAVLHRQRRITASLDTLGNARDASSWAAHWSALEASIQQHLRIEELALAPAIQAMGQRAHAVMAETRRRQVRRDLADLRCPSWADDDKRLRRLRQDLADHLSQEESWSYRALARHLDDDANAQLSARCRRVAGEVGA